MDDDDSITPDINSPDGSEVMDNCIRSFRERHRGEGPPEISTGIKALDQAIIGLRPKRSSFSHKKTDDLFVATPASDHQRAPFTVVLVVDDWLGEREKKLDNLNVTSFASDHQGR